MKKIILIFLSIFIIKNPLAAQFSATPLLDVLLADIELYKLKSKNNVPYIHAGDLLEHSFWTMYAAHELITTKSPYADTLNLSEREQALLYLACLLHDVGKAGRQELFDPTYPLGYSTCYDAHNNMTNIFFYSQPEHPCIGFEYIAASYLDPLSGFKSRYYCCSTGTTFDFDALFKQLNISQEEQKLIAILIGIHWDFGNVTCKNMSYQTYLEKLQDLVKAVHYQNDTLDEKLVLLSVFIQVADVKGLHYLPCSCCVPWVVNTHDFMPTHLAQLDERDPWQAYGYTTTDGQEAPALIHLKNLIKYFQTFCPL